MSRGRRRETIAVSSFTRTCQFLGVTSSASACNMECGSFLQLERPLLYCVMVCSCV